MKAIQAKKLLCVALVLSMVLVLFAACGSKGDDAIIGKWTATEIEAMGMTVSLEEFADNFGMSMDISFEFKSGGKVTGTVMGESVDGTYKANGNSYDITFDGDTETMTLEDGKLILDMEGVGKIVMEKK